MHLMPWISHPPLVIISNWCGEKCVTKILQNWKHKVHFVNQYNVSFIAMGWTPLEGLVMAKRRVAVRICAIQCGMWPCVIWEQSWNLSRNPLTERTGWKEFWRCSKTILEKPLVDKFNMHWNVSLKESNETSRS